MAKSKVAVVRVKPETILEDMDRLHGLAGVEQALDAHATTILKDNISWHFPFPGANTTPWQLEGTIRALRARGYKHLTCVQNKTVVTNAFKGEDLNHYVPIFKQYEIPVLYNFEPKDMTWEVYKPKAKMLAHTTSATPMIVINEPTLRARRLRRLYFKGTMLTQPFANHRER